MIDKNIASKFNKLLLNGIQKKQDGWELMYELCLAFAINLSVVSIDSELFFKYPGNMIISDTVNGFNKAGSKDEKLITSVVRGRKAATKFSADNKCLYAYEAIIINDAPFGMITISSMELDRDTLLFMVDKLSKLCIKMLKNKVSLSTRSTIIDSWLSYSLLMGDDRIVELGYLMSDSSSLSYFEKSLKNGYMIAVFQNIDNEQDKLAVAETAISNHLFRAFHIILDDKLLVFFTGVTRDELSVKDELYLKISDFCRIYKLKCGVSTVFQDLSLRLSYRSQAMTALNLATCDNRISLASDNYSELILSSAMENEIHGVFKLYELEVLLSYDLLNKTNYLETLITYLENNNRVTATAAKLFIDHSTLNYRLSKVEKMLNCDINDPEQALCLRIAALQNELTCNWLIGK